jgi:hypothetical protein
MSDGQAIRGSDCLSIDDSDDEDADGEMDMDMDDSDDDQPTKIISSNAAAGSKLKRGGNPYPLEGKYEDYEDKTR